MARLTMSNYLGMLQEDPENIEIFEGILDLLTHPDPAAMGENPVRLVEAARVAHERRRELGATAWLLEIQTHLAQEDPDLQAALWKELGRIRQEELLNYATARDAYEQALALRPGDEDVQDAIEHIDRASEKWRQIADRFRQEASSASDASLKSSLLLRAASLVWQYETSEKDRDSESDALFAEARAADLSDTRASRLHVLTLRARGLWGECAKVLLSTAQTTRSRDEKRNCFVKAARIQIRHLEQEEQGARSYLQVLALLPSHEEALRYLVEYYTERELWDDLVTLYEEALRSRQKVENEVGILMQLAMVHWRIRQAPEEAEPYFSRLRKIDPAHSGMLQFYREQSSDASKLLNILGDAHRVAKDQDHKLALAVELARAAQEDSATLERAIDAWKAVQRLNPGHAEAHESLKSLYRKAEKWNALVELLRLELERTAPDHTDEKLELLRQMIPVYRDKLALDVMVINTYNAILQEVPTDSEALKALGETFEAMGRWSDLIQILGKQAEAAGSQEDQVALYMNVANLWIKRFANYNQATKPLERVVEIDPKHLESIRLLKEIYGKKRAWSSLYDVLHKEYELVSDDAERLSLLVDRAKIAGDRLHRHADAVALWRQIARLAPETPGALDALERYAEREKDWPAVAEALELRVERAEDDRMRVKVLQKLGTVYGEHMRDASRAAGVWKRVLEMEPSNGRALRTLRETFIESADFEGLEALYSGVGDWEALVEVLGSAAERTEDSATKLRLSFRAAEIYEDQLEAPQRAFRNYERVLSVDPNNVRAARALLPIYEKGEKWSRVVGLLAVILHTLDEEAADERLSILKRLRELTSAKLSDHQAAFSWAKEAYRLAPKDPDTSKVLEADALATGKFEALVEVYESRLQLARELSEQLDLRRRLATLTGERLGRVDAAIEQLNMILAADPSDSEAIDVLQRLYQAENRTRDLRDLWVHQLEHVSSADEERIQLLFALADLEERSLQEPESALLRLLRVLELRPDDLGALRAVDRLFVALQRWNELVEVVTRQLQLVERDDERIQLADRLAELRLERLEDPKGALEAWGSVLELNLSDSSAIQGLEQIQSQYEDLSLRTGYLLEPAYEASSSWHKLSEVLRHRVQCAVDEPTKQSLRLRLAELLGSRLGDVQGAYATLESAFLDDPRDSELWEKLHAAAGAADRNHELVAAYSVAIEDGGLSSEDSAALARRAAEVWDVALGVPSNAERFHRKVLSVDSLDMVAFQSLKELYTEQERWEELQVLYRSRIAETIDAELKLELLQQLCFLFEEILDDAVMAIPAYQEVLELNPDHLPARRALERLFRKTERYDDLALLLQRNLEEANGQEAIDLTFELGDLYEKHLSEPEKAVDSYDAILTQSPTHMRAQEALERLIEIPEQRQRIARILEPLYEAQGGWRELARVLRVQLEDASDSVARVDLLLRIAEVYESREHDNAQAFEALSQALCCDPADSRSRQELARLAVLDRRNEDHAAVLERAVDASYGDAFLQSDLLLELAKLWDDRVQDHGRAALVYQRLIAIDDQNPDVVLPASRALERIHLAAGDFEALALDLKRQIYLEREQEVRAGLLLRLAELYESQLGQLDGAIQAHQERLQIDPLDQHSMRALEALYELTEQWKQLIDVLQIREASLPDEEEQRELARQVGSIYETRLKDVPGAIAAYNDVLVRFGSDRETLAALIRLYEQRGAWDDLREALRIDLELVQDVESRTELRFRMGELMREQLVDLEGAVEAYAEVLDIQPQHEGARLALEQLLDSSERSARVGAARTLVPLHEASERFEPLVRALCVMADVDDPMLQFQSLRRAAEVADVGLNDAQRAFELLGTSIRLALGDASLESLLLELERHASSSGRWKEYVSLLEEIAPDIFDGELQTQVLLRIAGTSAERLGDYEQARHYYTRVLENQPEHGPALDALERLHTEASDYPALLDILVRKTEIATDSELRVPLLVLQAQLCETQLEDIPAAIDAFEKVLNEAELPEAFEGLERLYERAERYLDLAQLLERKLEQGVGSPVEIQYKLGKISMEQLSDSFAALEYFRGAISARSDHQPSIDALELLMEDEDLRSSAAEILEPVFLAQMNWPKVTGALEARLSASVDVTLRKRLLRRLGEIFEDYLEDLEGARDQYARMFREDPTDSDVWETLGRMARVLDQWEHLAALYTEILESKVFGGEDSIQLAVMAGRLWDERLNNLDKADRCYSMALEFDPARTEVFAALESVRVRREAWPETLALYSDRIQVVDDDSDRASLHRRSAVVLEERLQDMEGAADAYRSVLEIDGSDVACWRALDRILGKLQRWPEQADHLWRRLELVEGTAEALELKCRLGQLSDDKLSDVDRAIDMYEEVLQVDPAHETALKALERLVLGEDHRLRITQILEPLYRSTGQWKKLVAILEAQIDLSHYASDRARLLMEIGDLHESRGKDASMAFHAYGRAFIIDALSEEPRRHFDRLAIFLGQWDQQIAAYEAAVSHCDDPATLSDLLMTIARIHDERRGDPRSAIETYERLLTQYPDDGSALDSLEALHTMIGDWRGLVDVLVRKVDRSYDPGERAEILRRAGSVMEELLGDTAGAVDAYRRASEDDPEDDVALESLDRLYGQLGYEEQLADVLGRRVELGSDPEFRVELNLRLARLLEGSLAQPTEAIEAYIKVQADAPEHEVAATALGRLYHLQSMWPDLLDNLRWRVELASEQAVKVELLCRSGEILETELHDLHEAMALYERALGLDPRHEESLAALMRMTFDEDFRDRAVEVLEPFLIDQKRWGDLAQVLDRKVEGTSDPIERSHLLARVAEVHENGRGDKRAAFESLTRAFDEEPSNPLVLEGLERLSSELDCWSEFADVLAVRASSVLDPMTARVLYVRLARVAEVKMSDLMRATEAYARALDQVGDDAELLAELDRLHHQSQNWPRLCDVLERRIGLESDPSIRNALLLRLGTVKEVHFDDHTGAFVAYQDVIEVEPGSPVAQEALERLLSRSELAPQVVEVLDRVYRETQQPAKLIRLFEVRSEIADSDEERTHLLREMAALYDTELGDPGRALEQLRWALLLDPRDLTLLDDLERLAARIRGWEFLRGAAEQAVQFEGLDRFTIRDLNLRAAGWYREYLADQDAAEVRLRAAIEADPDAAEAYERLALLLGESVGREADLISVLRGWSAIELVEDAKKSRLFQAASLAERALNAPELAAECYSEILAIDSADERALSELARIAKLDNRWPDLTSLLSRQIEVESVLQHRLQLRFELATVYEEALSDFAAASEVLEDLLRDDPGNPQGTDRLEQVYERLERWEDLRELMEQRLNFADTDEDRILARVRLARLSETAFGMRAEAMDQLQEILQMDPHNGEAQEELERLLMLEERWEDAARLLKERHRFAEESGDFADAVQVLFRMADIYARHLNQVEVAIQAYERVVELDPAHREALEALAYAHETQRNWVKTADVLERLIAVMPSKESLQVSHRLASVLEHELGDAARAEKILRSAFESQTNSRETRELLRSFYERAGDYPSVVDMLVLAEQDAPSAEERVRLLQQIAQIYLDYGVSQDRVQDLSSAAAYLERAAELAPQMREVLLPLCDLYISAGREVDAVPVLEHIIASYGNRRVKELAQYHHRLGRALEGMGDEEGALQHYDAAFRIELTNVHVLRDLGLLAHRRGDLGRAQKTFRALLLQKLSPDAGITKADVYYYLGDIAAREDDVRKAISMLERAIAEQIDHQGALALLEQLKH